MCLCHGGQRRSFQALARSAQSSVAVGASLCLKTDQESATPLFSHQLLGWAGLGSAGPAVARRRRVPRGNWAAVMLYSSPAPATGPPSTTTQRSSGKKSTVVSFDATPPSYSWFTRHSPRMCASGRSVHVQKPFARTDCPAAGPQAANRAPRLHGCASFTGSKSRIANFGDLLQFFLGVPRCNAGSVPRQATCNNSYPFTLFLLFSVRSSLNASESPHRHRIFSQLQAWAPPWGLSYGPAYSLVLHLHDCAPPV